MAKDSTGQTGRSTPESKRKPVTIDLAAEEVAKKPSGAGGSQQPTGAPEPKAAAAGSAKSDAPKPEAASPGKGAGPGPSAQGAERGKPTETITPSAFAGQTRKAEPPPRAPEGETHPRSVLSLIAAAIVGGAVVALAVVVLALAGYFRPPVVEGPDFTGEIAALNNEVAALKGEVATLAQPPADDALAPLREQVAALEQSVSALRSAPPPPAPDEAAIKSLRDDLSLLEERFAQLEQNTAEAVVGAPSNEVGERLAARLTDLAGQVEALRSASAPDLSGVERSLAALRGDVDALKSVPPPDLSGVESGLAELRQQLAALKTEVEALPREDRIAALETKLQEVGRTTEKAAGLGPAVAADALAAALESGRPFATELTALRTLGVDAEAVAALEPNAATGLATLAHIRARFESELAAVELARPVEPDANVIDRLIGSARNLVEVRPAAPTAGDDPGAVVARIRGALAGGELKAALDEWATLPEDVKSATAGFAETARARMTADDLVARLRAEALARLETEG